MTESPQPIAPHLGPTTATTLRRGSFWVEGTTVETDDGQHLLQGQMFVEWLAPERVSREWPLVLVHGGGGQGTDWLTTPDGRPGWAYRFAAEGYAVYVVDRPGFGRSPFHRCLPRGPDHCGSRGGLFVAPDTGAPMAMGSPSWEPRTEQLTAGIASCWLTLNSQRLDGKHSPASFTRSACGAGHTRRRSSRLAGINVPDLVGGIAAAEPMGPPLWIFRLCKSSLGSHHRSRRV